MSIFKHWSILGKQMLLNGVVIAIVIWLAGVSVKDFACLLVNQLQIVGEEKSIVFNQTMQFYLLRASLLAVLVAAGLHYYFSRRLLMPLKRLSDSARKIAEGVYPAPLEITSRDEVGKLTEDFNRLIEQLKHMEEQRKKIIGDIAHELRTPLTNMNGYLEALGTGVLEGDRTLFQSLHEESLRMIRLVDQLHQLNVWESRKIGMGDFDEIAVDRLVRKRLQTFEIAFAQKEIQVEIELDPGWVRGSTDGLKQVLDNFIQNVLQYDIGRWVEIKGEKLQGIYRLSVSNLGHPIPEDQKEKIFERFYRLETSRNRDTGGAGLGMAIAKEIVEQHGGKIGLISNANKHMFYFEIPLLKERKVR